MKNFSWAVIRNTPSLLARLALSLGIIIISSLFLHLAIPTFSKEPTQHQFCKDIAIPYEEVQTETRCVALGAAWQKEAGYCNTSKYDQYSNPDDQALYFIPRSSSCAQEFRDALQTYQRNAFIVFLAVFIVMLIAGLSLQKYTSVSYGLIYGSLVLLISGTIRYWNGIGDYWRLGLLAVALVVLIWLGIHIHQKDEKKKS